MTVKDRGTLRCTNYVRSLFSFRCTIFVRSRKGEAAYRVLLTEQPAYTEMLRQQGYTEEVVQQMREFAGEKVMNLAYALRDELAKRTPEMKALYEKVYGMPFPAEENYFRAFFDVGQGSEVRTLGERAEGKASGGGKIYRIQLLLRIRKRLILQSIHEKFLLFSCNMRGGDL